MIPTYVVAALAAERRSTLLAEARQRTAASATRRSPPRRFRGLLPAHPRD